MLPSESFHRFLFPKFPPCFGVFGFAGLASGTHGRSLGGVLYPSFPDSAPSLGRALGFSLGVDSPPLSFFFEN